MTADITDHEALMREAFEANERAIGNNIVRDGSLYKCERMTHRWIGYQDARQSAIEQMKPLVEALRKIAKMPDLPNPERDADWKNCMKWAAFYAQEALAAFPHLERKE